MSISESATAFSFTCAQRGASRYRWHQGESAPRFPESATLWRSSYAQILVLVADVQSEADLSELTREGQQWLDLSCMEDEKGSAAAVDGYLVAILARKPTSPMDALIRTLELNPVACRKHFIWPEEADAAELRWLRVFRVTPLGLPSSPGTFEMTGSPILDSQIQKRILDDIRTYRGAQQAARQHFENPSSAPSE